MDSDIKMFEIALWVAFLEDLCLKIYVKTESYINLSASRGPYRGFPRLLSLSSSFLFLFVSTLAFS